MIEVLAQAAIGVLAVCSVLLTAIGTQVGIDLLKKHSETISKFLGE